MELWRKIVVNHISKIYRSFDRIYNIIVLTKKDCMWMCSEGYSVPHTVAYWWYHVLRIASKWANLLLALMQVNDTHTITILSERGMSSASFKAKMNVVRWKTWFLRTACLVFKFIFLQLEHHSILHTPFPY